MRSIHKAQIAARHARTHLPSAGVVATLAAAMLLAACTGAGPCVPVACTNTTPVLEAITVTPSDATVFSLSAPQFKAVGLFSDASTKDLTAKVVWSSSSTRVAQFNEPGVPIGVATTNQEGSATITAALDKVSGTTTVTVTDTGYWTWILGPDIGGPGAAVAGIPPPRGGAASWTDNDGNFWLFGGYGYNLGAQAPAQVYAGMIYADMWEFTPATLQWTKVEEGSEAPSARSFAATWRDPLGNFWLFGGVNFGEVYDDLWEFMPATRQWIRVAQGSTVPSAREGAATWVDAAGNLWLFGGSTTVNDLWKFTIGPDGTGEWTEVSAGTDEDDAPVARERATSWTDSYGNFWLFGGDNHVNSLGPSVYADLWEYTPATNQWTFIKAPPPPPFGGPPRGNVPNTPGVYPNPRVQGQPGIPGPCSDAKGWSDGLGNLWLFPGDGSLWRYTPSPGEWTFEGEGPLGFGGEGETVYGTQGLPASTNQPGRRADSAAWVDPSHNLWLFGGNVVEELYLDDLWEFTPIAGR